MGYRSDIAICVPEKEYLKASKEVKEELEMSDIKKSVKLDFDKGLVFIYESIKWYDDYDHVKLILGFLKPLVRDFKQAGFIRIGEEINDIERYGDILDYNVFAEAKLNLDNLKEI